MAWKERHTRLQMIGVGTESNCVPRTAIGRVAKGYFLLPLSLSRCTEGTLSLTHCPPGCSSGRNMAMNGQIVILDIVPHVRAVP